jgi:DNA-binding NarL/FixJ family response regulator
MYDESMKYKERLTKWAERRAAIQAMHRQGFSFNDIARKLKISPQRVHQLVRKEAK